MSEKTERTLHKITLEPVIKMELNYEVWAHTEDEARKIAQESCAKRIQDAFDVPADGMVIAEDQGNDTE